MTDFALLAGAMALGAAALVLGPLLFSRSRAETRDAKDAALYRDQLEEVDRDLARGTISPGEAEGARAEIARRLLAAAGRAETAGDIAPAPRATSLIAALAVAVLIPGGAFFLYSGSGTPALLGLAEGTPEGGLGRPDLPDLPLATRADGEIRMARLSASLGGLPTQAEAEARAPKPEALPTTERAMLLAEIERARERIAADQSDVRSHFELIGALERASLPRDTWRAIDALIAATGERADPRWFEEKAMKMVEAAGFAITAEAAIAVLDALRLNPDSPRLRFYNGALLAQTREPERALEAWRSLRADAAEDAPWIVADVDRAMAELTRRLVAEGRMDAPAADGPSAAEMAAAEGLSAEQRRALIDEMVGGLEQRLTDDDGPREKWLQLVSSYRVLGRSADADRALALARTRLDADDIAWVEAALENAGTAPGPTAAEMAAAGELSEDERREMIKGMVSRLETRLVEDGSADATEWVRLVRSYMILGRAEDAQRIYALGQERLGSIEAAYLREQALLLGAISE